MRKIILAVLVLVVVLLAVVVLAVANVNTYLDENREQLAGLIGDQIGRAVAYERAEVAFQEGLAVRVGGLRVAEDPRFGKGDFLALDDAYVGVKLLPALSRRIEVKAIQLERPTIRVIQTSQGFNFSSLGGAAADEPAASEPVDAGAPFAVAIAALEIDDGTIHFEDRSSRDGLSLVIDAFSTSGSDLSLDGPVSFDFSGRVRSNKQADAGLESLVEGEVELESLETAVGRVHLESPSLHPALFGVRLEEGGQVERLDDFVADVVLPTNPEQAGYPIEARSDEARLAGFDLAEIAVDARYRSTSRGSAITLGELRVGVAGGSVLVNGDLVVGEPGRSPFALTTRLEGLDSGELVAVLLEVPRGFVSGELGGEVDLTGDSLEWESLKRSLGGSLRFEIGEGALETVNLLDTLVGRLVADPGLGALVANSLRDVAPKSLQGDRTDFENVNVALEVLEGAFRAEDLRLRAGEFAIEAAGRLGLDGDLSADGTLRFSEALSRKILDKADRLAPLLGEGDVVELPLDLVGTLNSPRLMPDLAALASKATGNVKQELTERATRELSEVLFGKRKDDGGDPAEEGDPAAADPADDPAEANRNAAEDLIRKGLGDLLGR